MPLTMALQGGQVQLEQSDKYLALNIAKMAIGWYSQAAREKTQLLLTTPGSNFGEKEKQLIKFPWHNMVKAATDRHPMMVSGNHTEGCLL
jgi:hypothetical protein